MTDQPAEHTGRKEETSSQPAVKPPVEQPTPPQTAPPSTSTATELDPEQIMMEFLQKLGQGVKASKVFARMVAVCKQKESAPPLTPSEVPPRLSTLQETPTPQTLTSLTEDPQIQTETPAPASPHTEATEISQQEEAEETEVSKTGGNDKGVVEGESSAKGVEGQEVTVVGDGVDKPKEDKGGKVDRGDEKGVTEGSATGDEIPDVVGVGETLLGVNTVQSVERVMSQESGQGDEKAVGVSNLKGETPVCDVSEEGTTVGVKEGVTPGTVEGLEGKTPSDDDKGKAPIVVEEEVPREKEEEVADGDDVGNEPETLIVDLVRESGEDDMPVDGRTTRRATRRSRMLEELEDTPRSRSLELGETEADISRAGGEQWAAEDFAQAEEQRLAAEQKRKGKSKAKASSKKLKPVSSALEIQDNVPEKIRVPFAKESLGPEVESETDIEEDSDQEEKPVYEKTEVWVTKKLLEAMAEFEDPKRMQTYKERGEVENR